MFVSRVVVSLRIPGLEKKSLVKIASPVCNCRMPNANNLAIISISRKSFYKTWQLINDMTSRQHMKKVIADIEIGAIKISSASELAEAFNYHFENIGH